jgi:hypothetical protein
MSAGKAPSDSWPTDTYFTPEWSIFSNGEAVQLFHVTAAASDGDTIVFFRRSDVVCTGAIFDTTGYPRFDPERGGSIAGIRAMVGKGLSLEQVKRARPTMDYDGLFERRSDWTSDMFIDAIYRDLGRSKP